MSIRKAFRCVEADVVEISENASPEIVTTVELQNDAIPNTSSIVMALEHEDTALGKVDFQKVTQSVEKVISNNKRGRYNKFTDKERYQIGKYASENGPARAVRHFEKKFPTLNESTVRDMKRKYEDEVNNAAREKRDVESVLKSNRRGRPLMLGHELDKKIQSYLTAVRSRGGLISQAIAIATAEAIIQNNPEEYLHCRDLDLHNSSWAKSLFRRMGFKRRMATTGKVDVPTTFLEEIKVTFLHCVLAKIQKYQIPPSMVINLDQTPMKYCQLSKRTQAKIGSKRVPLAASDDKRTFTATFAITLSGSFLPMQLIYGGKTKKSLPRVKFPDSFSLSVNPKHYSNETESIKFFKEVIIPYIESERKRLALPEQRALVLMDVFRGQMTDAVLNYLEQNLLCCEKIPANMTRYFQPLDLTVNGEAKKFISRKFSLWYSNQIIESLQKEKPLEQINVELKLSILKPLHAGWIKELYNYLTSGEATKIILDGWRRAGILDAVENGKEQLPPLDPFHDIDPMLELPLIFEPEELDETMFCSKYANMELRDISESDSDWEDEEGNPVNASCIIDDDEED